MFQLFISVDFVNNKFIVFAVIATIIVHMLSDCTKKNVNNIIILKYFYHNI